MKSIDAYDFRGLKHLELAYLGLNDCISQDFIGVGGQGLEIKVAMAVATSCGMKDEIELVDALIIKNDLEKDLVRLEEKLKCEAMAILPEYATERNETLVEDLQAALTEKLGEFENLHEILRQKIGIIHQLEMKVQSLRRDNDILRILNQKN